MSVQDYRAQQSGAQIEDVVDLGKVFATLWRGKFLILFCCAAMIFLGGYYAYYSATPRYRSTAVVMLNNREEQVVDLDSVLGGLGSDSSVINTELEILRSRSLLTKVVTKLDLTSDPEFNPSLRTPTGIAKFKGQIKTALFNIFGLTEIEDEVVAADDAQRVREMTINNLLENLSIRNVPQSLVFQVTVETTAPKKSTLIADTIVDLYILNQLEVKFDATEQATSWLTDRVTELQISLENAERRVKDFRSSTTLVSRQSLEALEIQIKDIRERIETLTTQGAAQRERLAALEAADTPEAQVAASGDLRLRDLLPRIDTPQGRALFEARFEDLLTRARLDLQRMSTQQAALETSRTEMQQQIDSQSADLIQLQQLTREAEASRLLYEYFLGRLKETSAQQGIQQADSRRLSQAVVPVNPSAPRKPLILAGAGFVGLFLGMLLVLWRESRNTGYRSSEDLERELGYTVVGQLPLLPTQSRSDVLSYIAEKPSSGPAEAVRNLRTSLMLSNVDTPPKVIMVSSSIPGEGKTTVSMLLAQSYGGMGKKILLVEGDVRRRVFNQFLDNDPKGGLVAVLAGEQTLDEVISFSDKLRCDILFGGLSKANAADLFSSERFAATLRQLREHYDYIVIDTPPVLVVPDARIIAQHADAVAFVIKWDSTGRSVVSAALRDFENVSRSPNGIILNQINGRRMKRYGYDGRYGAYATYGSKYHIN